MAKVLIVAEHLGGKLNASTAKVVSAAKALNPESIDVVVGIEVGEIGEPFVQSGGDVVTRHGSRGTQD